ncbi:cobyrinate a,c-diamide synthase [Pseudoduganella sp. UC29_106]|uniref:cobyrinate a,c-diamide synthase n=1 Tax=Pseudoduganella sp. UC29_106 TaxID=3374553 RepID=UPI00375645E4
MARAVLVAAAASGQGKTTVTAALARKLRGMGQRVRVFKCGPDFIDPMILARASGAPVQTLDLWMVGREESRRLLAEAAREADAILIEGVMGLYDGTPSAADLANEFGLPVLAVIDAGAMAQTAGALVMGLRDYGPVRMAGVIANRVASARHAEMVASSLRDIPLLGSLAKQPQSLPERHLGLVLPDEQPAIEGLLDTLADQLALDAAAWDALPVTFFDATTRVASTEAAHVSTLAGRTIAVARDAAFAFIYPANIDTLTALGARIAWFSPLADEPVPAEADAVYLPGGYPELHAAQLSQASQWQASIRAAHEESKPIVAECGGMMAIAESLTAPDGTTWQMAGLLPGRVAMQSRLAGLGPQALPTSAGPLRGHTFHYSLLETSEPAAASTIKHPSGVQGEAVYQVGSLHASYFHAYFASNPDAVAALFTRGAA